MHKDSGLRIVDEIPVIPMDGLWRSLDGTPTDEKLAQALSYSGCEFHDESGRLVKGPSVALAAVGGVPVAHEADSNESIADNLHFLLSGSREMMASSAAFSYLNSGEKLTEDLYETVTRLGHFSIAHAVQVNVVIAGISAGTETELSLQRDIVHLSKLTNARTKVQNNPPLVIPDATHADQILALHDQASELAAALRTDSSGDTLEFANGMFSINKATILMISGSLKNMKKLAELRHDDGKELGLREVSEKLYTVLGKLWPEIMEVENE